MKITSILLASILYCSGFAIASESNANYIETINVNPHWDSQTVDLTFTVFDKTFEIKNTTFEDLALLNVKPGDSVEIISENVDFSNYGYSIFELFFVSSGVKINAMGMSTPNLITPSADPKHVFNFNKQDGSFKTEGDLQWIVNKKEPFPLNNGDAIYIENEKVIKEVIGASLYDVISSTGEYLGQVMGDSSHWELQDEWEPELKARVFKVARGYHSTNTRPYYAYTNDLYNVLTSEKVTLPHYPSFPVDHGERIVLLDYQIIKSLCGEGWPCEVWSATLYNLDRKVMLWWSEEHVFSRIKSDYPFTPLEILPWHVSVRQW